ncbi:gasdermin-E [Gasterosteus aculeatus]
MFAKATAKFVHQVDPEGSLIHVSRVNDSKKLVPMALVVKRNRIWFWQKPKYQATDLTLNDLLQGDKVLAPDVSKKEFLSYEGTFQGKLSGNLCAEIGSSSAALQGEGSSQLQSCFGKLNKEELDVRKLLQDSSGRLVEMQNPLMQQLEKRADVLAVVKERVLTTKSCSITQTEKEQCTFQGILGLLGMLGSVKVFAKDSGNIEAESVVSLEIPSGTVIAYSILELEIKKNGHFDICLQPGTIGGIEADSFVSDDPLDPLDTVDRGCNGTGVPEKVATRTLPSGSQEMDLSPLAELPESTRWSFFKRLQEALVDRTALSYMQCVLEELCGGETLDVAEREELSESQRTHVPARLSAAHLLLSAMEELPDETLSLLSESRPDFLEALDTLMCRLKGSEPVSIQRLPLHLQDNPAFELAEQLLGSTEVTLRRDGHRLWTETANEVLQLVLCLSIHGLSLLCKGLK